MLRLLLYCKSSLPLISTTVSVGGEVFSVQGLDNPSLYSSSTIQSALHPNESLQTQTIPLLFRLPLRLPACSRGPRVSLVSLLD